MEINEVKLGELGKVSKVSDMRKAAHSQGVDLGDEKRDAHHIDFPGAKHRKKDGGSAKMQSGKQIGGSANKDKLTNATLATKVKDAVVDRQKKATGSSNPGYWKKPENKDQRKADQKKAREEKYAKRNKGFTRTENKPDARRKKVFEQWLAECKETLQDDWTV